MRYKKGPAGTTLAAQGFYIVQKYKSDNLRYKKAPAGTTLAAQSFYIVKKYKSVIFEVQKGPCGHDTGSTVLLYAQKI